MDRFIGLIGIALIMGGCYLFSTSRKSIRFSLIAWGMGLQLSFAFIVLKPPAGNDLRVVNNAVTSLHHYVTAGSEFLFGPLGKPDGPFMTIFAFQVLPIVIFIASL